MSKQSATSKILAALSRSERLTQLDATSRWGITRLASTIHTLRKLGHEIVTENAQSAGRKYAIYYMEPTP